MKLASETDRERSNGRFDEPPHPGEMLSQMLFSDSTMWEVIAATHQTLTVRRCQTTERAVNEHRDGNPYPVTFKESVPDPDGAVHTLRLRSDGTYRPFRGSPLVPAATTEIDGDMVPYTVTDYRY